MKVKLHFSVAKERCIYHICTSIKKLAVSYVILSNLVSHNVDGLKNWPIKYDSKYEIKAKKT